MAFPPDLTARYPDAVEIGRGGMGTVYQATNRDTGVAVAIKVLETVISQDPEMRERFEIEVRLADKVSSAHVVQVLQHGETVNGQLYMVTELVVGSSLRKILDAKKQLSAPKVIGIGRALLAGLAAIHDAGIIHRDIKPANLMVDRQGSLKIIDFGIARDTADKIQRTRTGTLMGSPSYLSPEQVSGDPTDAASDVYSAGVILYECLVGKPPFTGENLYAILNAHLTDQAEPLENLVPDVPKALARVVHKMLAKDPAKRYKNGREALSALKAASGDRGAAARTLEQGDASDVGASLVPGRLTAQRVPTLPRPTRVIKAETPAPPARALPRNAVIAGAGAAFALLALLIFLAVR